MQLAIQPGGRIVVNVTFDSTWENGVSILDQASQRLLKGFNNYFGGGGTWDSGVNDTQFVKLIDIEGCHKDGGPSGGLGWFSSPEKLLFDGKYNKVIGYSDGNGGGYNAAEANVAIHAAPDARFHSPDRARAPEGH
jgi:hypothetical protein